MNIFYTNTNPIECAEDHCKVHRNKMIIEYAQLLSTTHHVLDGDKAPEGIYKATHVNHPSAVWVRESFYNYTYVYDLFYALCREYLSDNLRGHKTGKLTTLLHRPPTNISMQPLTPIKLAMPDEFKQDNPCKAYQDYLNSKYMDWLTRDKPMKVEFTHGYPEWLSSDVKKLLECKTVNKACNSNSIV